jgi:hypothetical protein
MDEALLKKVRAYRDAFGPDPAPGHKGARPPFTPAPGSMKALLDEVIDAFESELKAVES